MVCLSHNPPLTIQNANHSPQNAGHKGYDFPRKMTSLFLQKLQNIKLFLCFPLSRCSFTNAQTHAWQPIKPCPQGPWQDYFALRSSESLNSDYEIYAQSKSHTSVSVQISMNYIWKQRILTACSKLHYSRGITGKCAVLCLKLHKAYRDVCSPFLSWINNITCTEWF